MESMSQYGSDVTEAPVVQDHSSPVEGVQKRPLLLEGMSDLFGMATGVAKASNEKKANSAVAELTRKNILVADANAQGRIGTSAMAKNMMRANLLDAIDANPNITADLIKAQGTLNIMGVADVVDEGTREEQVRMAREDYLISNGFLDPDNAGNEDAFQEADSEARNTQTAMRRYQEITQAIDLRLKSINLTEAERRDLEAQKTEEARRVVRDTSKPELNAMRSTMEGIALSGATEAEKVQAIEEQFIAFQSSITTVLGSLNDKEIAAYMTPFKETKELYLKLARGELSDAEVKRQNERNLNAQKNILLTDPELAGIAAGEELFNFGPEASAMKLDAFRRFTRLIAENSGDYEGDPTSPFKNGQYEEEALQTYFRNIADGVSANGELAPKAAQHLNNFFGSIEDFEAQIRKNPERAISLVRAMASQDFYKAISNSNVSAEQREAAARVIRDHFSQEVWEMVQKEFSGKKVRLQAGDEGTAPGAEGYQVDMDQMVGVRTTSSGMEFYALSDSSDAGLMARNLNKDLKPIINQLVQASAHLSGSNDYKAQWEAAKEAILGGITTDEGDNLSIDSFNLKVVNPASLPADVKSDTAFMDSVHQVHQETGILPEILLGVMDFETGASFDPALKNAAGSSGTGLIQFMGATAKSLGTSVGELSKMSRSEQMVWVGKYLKQYSGRIDGNDPADVYMAVLYPKAIGKSGDYVLFKKGTLAYTQNSGLDKNKDGTVTKDEAAASVIRKVGKYK